MKMEKNPLRLQGSSVLLVKEFVSQGGYYILAIMEKMRQCSSERHTTDEFRCLQSFPLPRQDTGVEEEDDITAGAAMPLFKPCVLGLSV